MAAPSPPPHPAPAGSHRSHRGECLQNVRVPGGAVLREPLQPEAAGQDRAVLSRILWRYDAGHAARKLSRE